MFVQLKDFPDYVVTDEGEVISLVHRNAKTRKPRWKRMQTRVTNSGYEILTISVATQRKTCTVHSLVASAFLGSRPEGKDVNHKDGDKLNNHADNLEYCSRSDNLTHAFASGLAPKGQRHGRSKFSDTLIAEVLSLKGKATQREVAKRFGMSQQYVGKLWRGDYRSSVDDAE